jgi:hypothetical protein
MTPKEKAQQLIDLYSFANFKEIKFAHNCALIAVDEIINIAYWEYMESMGEKEKEYWNEVIQEIKLL